MEEWEWAGEAYSDLQRCAQGCGAEWLPGVDKDEHKPWCPVAQANKTRKQRILDTASDAGLNFSYYDRKECEDLPVGAIDKAIEDGEVTVEEILAAFREGAGL